MGLPLRVYFVKIYQHTITGNPLAQRAQRAHTQSCRGISFVDMMHGYSDRVL